MDPILKVDRLSKTFGGLHAVSDVGFDVQPGEIVGIIGPNGAGKTTLFNLLTGFLVPTRGNVFFKDKNVVNKKPNEIVGFGISRTFQIVRPFRNMTVIENVMVPLQSPKHRSSNRSYMENQHRAAKILHEIGLGEKIPIMAGDLSHGDLRRLELARSLAAEPDLLLLDEPFSGLGVKEIDPISSVIKKLNDEGLTIIIIEHKLRELMKLARRVIVLNFGMKLADGTPQEIARNQEVIRAYLGKGGERFVTA